MHVSGIKTTGVLPEPRQECYLGSPTAEVIEFEVECAQCGSKELIPVEEIPDSWRASVIAIFGVNRALPLKLANSHARGLELDRRSFFE